MWRTHEGIDMVLSGILAVAFVVLVAVLLFKLGKGLMWVLANSVIGLVVFAVLNIFFGLGIDINIWSLLVVGIGGVIGLVVVILLHFVGIAF